MVLHGVTIADPARSNMRFNRADDHFTVTRKQPGKPLAPFVSEQDRLNNFDELSTSVRQSEKTIPFTNADNLTELDLWRVRRDNLRAEVEVPQLEAEKKTGAGVVDAHERVNPAWTTDTYGVNFGSHYDPKGVYPTPTFKVDSRINLHYVHPSTTLTANSNELAKQFNYLYVKDYGNYQKYYYTENPWKSATTGRVHLFERPFTRNFA